MICEVLHIRPWEQRDLLTVEEFLACCRYVDQIRKAHEDTAARTKRRR